MNIKIFLSFLFAAVMCATLPAQSQATTQDTTLVQIQTTDGNQFVGSITYEDQQKIKIQTERFGLITLAKIDIVSIRRIRGLQKENNFWPENPQATRYFWSPNGYGLRKGEGYYHNVWVLFNQVSVGVTDHLSIGAGIVPLFLFAGTSTPIWFNTKFSIPIQRDQVNLGIGALAGTVTGEEGTGFGIFYGVTTFGNRDKNLSIGVGYGVADGEASESPTISISGMIRTGARGYFLTDNYLLGLGDETVGLLSVGGRRMFKNAGLDYGLVIPFSPDQTNFVAIPWLGVTIAFGDKKKKSIGN